jgi:signal transduction histidine kinase
MARTLANIGNIYFEQKEHERALQHYREALSLLDTTRHSFSISGITVFAADACMAMERLEEAEHLLFRALLLIRKLKLKSSEAYAIQSLGTLRGKQYRWNEAIDYYQQSLALYRTLDSWRDLESVFLDLSQAYIETKQYDRASTFMREGITLAEKHKHALGLQEFYASIAKLDSIRGNYKDALAHFQRSVYYRDTLFTVEKASAIEVVNQKYATLQKEKIIEEQQQVIQQHKTNQGFALILISVAVMSGVPIVFFVKRKQRVEHGLEQEKQRKKNLMSIVMAQEQMQQKIARDLHDSLVQVLSGAKIGVESLRADITNPLYAEKLRETTDIIDLACHEARSIAHHLLPYSLQRHGLVLALEELFEKNVKRVMKSVTFAHRGLQERLKDIVEINVYRIVQELMNNAIKHSAAAEVSISLMKQDDQLILVVSDNGQGLSPGMQKGAGLMNIESRLQVLLGTLVIESTPGKGVTTTINIPL